MATRRSPLMPLALLGLLALLAALGWLLLGPQPDAPDEVAGAPIVEAPAPAPTDDMPMPEPVEPGPALQPAPAPAPRVGSLGGRVVNQDRVPLEDALVSLFRGNPGPLAGIAPLPALGLSARVDAQGRFVFEQVPAQDEVVVRVTGEAFEARQVGPFPVFAEQLTDVGDVPVGPGLDVAGVVLGERGQGLAGARVALSFGEVPDWGEPDPVPLRVVVTEQDGRFAIPHAPRAPFVLLASAPGYGRAAATQGVVIDPGQLSAAFTLNLQPAAELVGRVIAKPDDRPLPQVEVRVLAGSAGGSFSARATTDANGRFTIHDLAPGPCKLVTDPVGYLRKQVRVDADSFGRELTLAVQPASAIEGRVVDERGHPMQAFDLALRHSTRLGGVSDQVGPVHRVRDAAGRFRVDDLEPGYYLFEVWAKDHAVTLSEPVRVTKGKTTKGVELPMQLSALLAGRVLDDLGQPIAGAVVSLHTNHSPTGSLLRQGAEHSSWEQTTRTDEEGRFQLRDVTERVYQLEVDHPDYPLAFRNDVAAQANRRTELEDIVLPRPASVSGTVIGLDGQVLGGVKVSLGGGDSRTVSRETISDGQGHYRFDRLEPGDYTIRVFSPHSNPMANLVTEIQRISRDQDGKAVLLPDFVLQAGQDLEYLVRADA